MNDGPSRAERLLNLLAFLLETSVPVSQDEIVREVSGYPEGKTAYRRAFERDKETLRNMGVPVSVEPLPYGDGNEVGYRVHAEEYYLPDLDLTPEESAALNVAVNAISLGSAAGHGALMKLGGLTGSRVPPIASLPLVPALPALFEGFRRQATVEFDYRGEHRVVEPWGITSHSGRWYVVGFDRSRGAPRTFRADRIEGDVRVGEPHAFSAPDDFRPEDHLREPAWLWGEDEPTVVHLLVSSDHAAGVVAAVPEAREAEQRPGGVVFEIPVVNRPAFRSFVLGFLEHAEVLAPPEMRADVVAWLRAVAAS
jgi:proteasome accessory factor B